MQNILREEDGNSKLIRVIILILTGSAVFPRLCEKKKTPERLLTNARSFYLLDPCKAMVRASKIRWPVGFCKVGVLE